MSEVKKESGHIVTTILFIGAVLILLAAAGIAWYFLRPPGSSAADDGWSVLQVVPDAEVVTFQREWTSQIGDISYERIARYSVSLDGASPIPDQHVEDISIESSDENAFPIPGQTHRYIDGTIYIYNENDSLEDVIPVGWMEYDVEESPTEPNVAETTGASVTGAEFITRNMLNDIIAQTSQEAREGRRTQDSYVVAGSTLTFVSPAPELVERPRSPATYSELREALFEAVSGDVDSDEDGLTDAMESVRGTNPQDADSDDDGYSDGEEVENGYNPLGPGKLIEFGTEPQVQ